MIVRKYNLELTKENLPVLNCESSYKYDDVKLSELEATIDLIEKCCRLNQLAEEKVVLLCLDKGFNPIGIFDITHNNPHYFNLSIKDILTKSLISGAKSIVIARNNIEQTIGPNKNDNRVCRQLNSMTRNIGITLQDFIIIGDYIYSFRENGGLKYGYGL